MPLLVPGKRCSRKTVTILFAIVFSVHISVSANPQSVSPVPYVEQPLVPASARPGGAEFTLTVSGSGFVPQSVVNWNGSPRATTFVSSVRLTTMILASDIATKGTASVTVSNPSPGGGTSNVTFFQVMSHETNVALGIKGAPPCLGSPMVSGDFNGDGKLDLVSFAYFGGSSFSILLGNGNGTFRVKSSIATGHAVGGLVVGDFNNDGKLDLAGIFDASKGVEIALGNGDGTFQRGKTFATGTLPAGVAAGDFNEDGKLDIAVANYDNGQGDTVSILLGNGDGTLQAQTPMTVGLGPINIAVGDFNGDGHLDIAVGNVTSGTISVLLGNGDGTFQPAITTGTVASGTFDLAAADFNGDGKLDLAITGNVKAVSVLLGNGDGTFASPMQFSLPGYAAGSLVMGDFNGDGILDLAVGDVTSFTYISVLRGNGDGTFAPPSNTLMPGVSPGVVGDFNGDGRLDLECGCVVLQVDSTAAVNPTFVTFTELVGSTSSPKKIKLTNTGNQPITISSVTISGSQSFAQSNDCPSPLNIDKSCFISVTFAPAMSGNQAGTLIVSDSAYGGSQTVALTGIGTGLVVSPTSLTFGSEPVGQSSAAQSVTLTNIGTAIINFYGFPFTGPNRSDFSQTNNCGSALGVGANCTVNVTFTPSGTGTRNASMDVGNDGGSRPSVSLTGTGT